MRDAFAVLFFVSVGMLLDPRHLFESPWLLAATLAVILIGKPLTALVIVLVLGYPPKTAFSVAVALAQIGEFSFILATVAKQLGVLTIEANNTLVGAAIISITLNPPLYRLVDPVAAWAARRPRLWRLLTIRMPSELARGESRHRVEEAGRHRAVVVGYGPVGQTVARLLRENDIEPTVVELNVETVRRLRSEGVPAFYGDATHRDTLKNAGVESAGSLILSSAGMSASEEVIRLAREMNPDIRILARSSYVREMTALRHVGAEHVFSAEGEVALAMTVAILDELGATPEQIDRERERVYNDLLSDGSNTTLKQAIRGNGNGRGSAENEPQEGELTPDEADQANEEADQR
jgi:CPA2 family monovalent cation:H+ antiporter-2